MSYALSSLLLAGALSSPPQEIRQPVLLHESTLERFNVVFGGEEPEPDYNCDEVDFVDAGLMMLVQVPASADDELRTELRILAKAVAEEAVLRAQGPMNDLFQNGSLFGVEVDWYFPTDGQPPTPNRLDVVCELLDVPGPNGDLQALLYGYDETQYAGRVGFLTAGIGHGLDLYPTWIAPVLANLDGDKRDLCFWMGGQQVVGDLSSSDDVMFFGASTVVGDVAYAGALVEKFAPTAIETINRWPVGSTPPAITVEGARAAAMAGGVYSAGMLLVDSDNRPPNGAVIFAEGNLRVELSDTTASWTLVSAHGRIDIIGHRNRLTPAVAWTSAIAYEGQLRVLGDENTLVGCTLAPLDRWTLWGNGNLLTGAHRGHGMSIGGTGNLFSDGTVLEPLP